MTDDWVITYAFDVDPTDSTLDQWADHLESADGSIARLPGMGIEVTVYVDGHLPMLTAAQKIAGEVTDLIHAGSPNKLLTGEQVSEVGRPFRSRPRHRRRRNTDRAEVSLPTNWDSPPGSGRSVPKEDDVHDDHEGCRVGRPTARMEKLRY